MTALTLAGQQWISVLLHLVTHGDLWVLLQDLHHALVTLALFLLLASNSLLPTLRLPLLDLLDLAPGKERWSAHVMSQRNLGKQYLCSFISFHSENAPLIPSAAIPTAAAS